MDTRHTKIVLASIVALVGVLAAGRMVWQRMPASKPKPVAVPAQIKPEVAAVFDGGFDTIPTPDSVDADIRRARETARDRLESAHGSVIPKDRRDDLAAAFEERLAAVADPDYMRDLRARIDRGQRFEYAQPDPDELDRYMTSRASFTLPPMDIASIEVHPIYQRGVSVSQPMTAQGFGEGTTVLGGAHAFPMAGLDPVKHKLDIVEIRMPIKIPVPVDHKTETRERNLVGFQFVWNTERQQWIPWVIKAYGNPNHGVFGLPF